MDTIVNIFPSNFISPMVESNMLQVIVIALLLGFSIIKLGEKNIGIVKACNNINEIFMKCMEMILKLSPIGVFCLLCPVVASNGAAIIGSLAMVLLAAYICLYLTCSCSILCCSENYGRHKSGKILQRNASGDHVRFF